MITVTYRYTCDYCSKEFAPADTLRFHPQLKETIPQPQAYGHIMVQYHVCGDCADAAITGLRERGKKLKLEAP